MYTCNQVATNNSLLTTVINYAYIYKYPAVTTDDYVREERT